MKSVRRNVFETNSSSTHSLTIEYGGSGDLSLRLPDNRGYELGYFDILRYPLPQDGVAEGQVEKLRIIVSLISEYIDDELNDKIQTQVTLCAIRHTIDTTDEFYEKEQNYYDEQIPEYSNMCVEYQKILFHSPYRQVLEE